MGFQTQKLKVATLFGLVMDHATHDGMESIRWLISRARRPVAPKNSAEDEIQLERSFQAQCDHHGYTVSAKMRGREHARTIVTQINIKPKEGRDIKIIETAKTDPKPDDPKRLAIQVKLRESISEALIQQMTGQPLTKLIVIEGPIGKILEDYTITRIYSSRTLEGFSAIDANLSGE